MSLSKFGNIRVANPSSSIGKDQKKAGSPIVDNDRKSFDRESFLKALDDYKKSRVIAEAVPTSVPVDNPVSTDTGTFEDEMRNFVAAVNGSDNGGGMSFGDYLENYGTDTEKAYSQMVRQANSDYYRTLMTYGKNAEALGGAGLVGAGVSDYGDVAAYAARQGAVATAGAAKMETDAKQAASYAEYLQNFKAQKAAEAKAARAEKMNLITSMMTLGDRDAALGMLNAYGFTDEAEYNSAYNAINSYYDGVDKKAEKVTQTVTDATQTEANTRYNELTASGMAPDAAEIQVNQEYGDGFGTNARNNTKEITQTHDNAAVDTMLTGHYSPFSENAYTVDYFKKQVAAGNISEEEAEVQIEKIENANLDWVYEMLSDANNPYKIDDVKQELEINEEFSSYETEVSATVNAVFDRLRELVTLGEMSEEKATEIYKEYFKENVTLKIKNKEGIEKYLQAVSTFSDKVGYMDSSNDIYGYMVNIVADGIKVRFDPIEGGQTISMHNNSGEIFEMRMNRVSPSEVSGVAKIGAFSNEYGKTVVVYDNGVFKIDGKLYKVSPRGTVSGYGYKKPDKGMAQASVDVFDSWLRLKIGAR